MTKQQALLVGASIVLVLLMVFGLRTVPRSHALVEKSRALNVETFDAAALRDKALPELSTEEKNFISSLENIVRLTKEDTVKVKTMKQLSGAWYELGRPGLAGYWAREVAEKLNTAEAWSVSGATFATGLNNGDTEIRNICFTEAVGSFENAISLDPENPDHRINLAICYAEHPIEGDPMRGIRSLVDIADKNPDNAAVRYHLARFAVKTGQTERAIERLEQALEIDPGYIRAHCLLADLYEGTDQGENAVKHRTICEKRFNNE